MQVYFVPHVEGAEQSARLGARWLAQHRGQGIPFILVPSNGHVSNNDVIRELVEGGVRWGIPRNFPPVDWAGGPVLAPWASDKVIECVGRWSERITSVCVLKWLEEDHQDWLTAHEAVDVTDPNRVPTPPTIDDGVVLAALEDITGMINMATGLTHDRDRLFAISRLDYLRRWNRELVAAEIVSWALANGWTKAGADALREIIQRLNAGRTFKNIRQVRVADRGALLKKWEQRAAQRAGG